MAEFVEIGLLATQGLYHAHAGDVFVVGASDLGVNLAHLAVFAEDAFLELGCHDNEHWDNGKTQSSASCQLMMAMKNTAVAMFIIPHVTSSRPHVTNSATRSESDVTRDMIQPTGVRSK